MAINIGLPCITGTTPAEQIRQLNSYLYQMAEQLNWALSAIETPNGDASAVKIEQSESISPKEAEDTFNSIKALIIKSADIVKAYEETIMTDFNGTYFADSDFGTYLEKTSLSIEENSKGVNEVYTLKETIVPKVDGLEEENRTTNAYIKRGYLGNDDGKEVYGVAVGETDENGVYKRYAWFTADRLTFFDENDTKVAYIGNGCLYIVGRSVFLGELQLGGYIADTSDGLAFTWI